MTTPDPSSCRRRCAPRTRQKYVVACRRRRGLIRGRGLTGRDLRRRIRRAEAHVIATSRPSRSTSASRVVADARGAARRRWRRRRAPVVAAAARGERPHRTRRRAGGVARHARCQKYVVPAAVVAGVIRGRGLTGRDLRRRIRRPEAHVIRWSRPSRSTSASPSSPRPWRRSAGVGDVGVAGACRPPS